MPSEQEILQRYRENESWMRQEVKYYLQINRIYNFDFEIALSWGGEGLLEAARDWDPAKKPWKYFARMCIHRKVTVGFRSEVARHQHFLAYSLDMPSFSDPTIRMGDCLVDPKAVDPETFVLRQELIVQVRKNLEVLSPLEKYAIEQWMAGSTYRTIADSCRLDYKTIDNAITRAKRKPSRALKQSGL